jgi:hypothetical protein
MSPRCQQIACEIAQLIYESQTACYAKDRRNAIHKLGDRYDCATHPSVMSAFLYALNDTDERVRAKAADEIGDQLRANPCCCCCGKITDALTCALADCHKGVRKEAEQALEICGYDVVEGCYDKCANGAAPSPPAPRTAPTPDPVSAEVLPQPAPKSITPTVIRPQRNARPISKPNRLSTLFGLVN